MSLAALSPVSFTCEYVDRSLAKQNCVNPLPYFYNIIMKTLHLPCSHGKFVILHCVFIYHGALDRNQDLNGRGEEDVKVT